MHKRSTVLLSFLLAACSSTAISPPDSIRITSPAENSYIGSRLTVTGEARGTWFFEASFPVRVEDTEGNILAHSYAQAEREWMTEEFVPFTSQIEIPLKYSGPAILILSKDDPSGLLENVDSITLHIVIDPTLNSPINLQIHPLPSELSLDHFAKMKLEGNALKLKSILAENSAYTRYSIQYNSNGLRISGILNIPKGDGPFPLVLLNHGFINPAVYTNGRGLKREQDFLVREGFSVLHSDYRGHALSDPSPDESDVYDAGIEYSMDVVNAISAIRSAGLPSVDTTRIGMLGHSLGGGITLNILTAYPNLVDAAILYAPVHADAWENFSRWRSLREEGDRTRKVLGTREENPTVWDALSPSAHLQNIRTPILLFHGTNDVDVPKAWSDLLYSQLQALQKESSYIEYKGEKHEFIAEWEDFMRKTVQFLRKNM
jgi:uncharacterized protein